MPGGSTQSKAYDGLLQLTASQAKTPSAATTLSLAHTFGKRFELQHVQRSDTAGGITRSKDSHFNYDDELRLTQAETGGAAGADTETFTLDAVANRTAHNKFPGAWQFDGNNRLIKRGDGVCGVVGTVCYDYDDAGNLKTKTEGTKVTQYSHDTLNRLVEVKDGAGQPIARYGYDPFGRRLWKEQYRDQDGNALAAPKRTTYLYADEGLIAEATQAITLSADGSVTASAAPVVTTQYGSRPHAAFATGMLFIKTQNSKGVTTLAFYHHDHLGTPIQATDKTGRVVWAADYNAFGLATIITPAATDEAPTISSNLRLPGQYWDEETGLHYNWHRYYYAATGRYIQSDPIGLRGGVNTFAYVDGSPLMLADPMGLQSYGSPNRPPGWPQTTPLNPNCATAECVAGIPGGTALDKGLEWFRDLRVWLKSPENQCLATCDLVAASGCKGYGLSCGAAVTAATGPVTGVAAGLTVYGACNVGIHYYCHSACSNIGPAPSIEYVAP